MARDRIYFLLCKKPKGLKSMKHLPVETINLEDEDPIASNAKDFIQSKLQYYVDHL